MLTSLYTDKSPQWQAVALMWTLATVGIAVLEQAKPVGDRRGQHAVESGKHSTFA
jgi:hypothetical protein